MNFVLNVPFVGRALSRETAPEVETVEGVEIVETVERAPLPVGAIAAIIAFAAVWLALGAAVVSTLGDLGPLLTSIRTR